MRTKDNGKFWNYILILGMMLIISFLCIPVKAAQALSLRCTLLDANTIEIQGQLPEKYQSEQVHLLISNASEDITKAQDLGVLTLNNGNFTYNQPLLDEKGSTRLCQCFCLALPGEGEFKQISSWHYITNPEILSQNAPARNDHGIKGILPATTETALFNDLGIQQIMFNLELGSVIAKNKGKDTEVFHYAGKDYYFITSALEGYDRIFKWCSDNNYQLNVTLLNASSSQKTKLIHPDAKDPDRPTYALNTKEEDGINQLRAVIAFLARRYMTQEHGIVDNWILGNQVNARTEWYYLKSSNLDVNAHEYAKAFRIVYNEIKAANKNANVYLSLDQEWNKKSNPGCFTSREYMSRFAYFIKEGGDIDWGLGIHPYNAPIYDPYAWLQQEEYVYDNTRSPYLTISNIDILIQEMKKAEYLNSQGNIRNIMLSEIGYSSSFGEELQAASIAYAYNKALQYPEIKGFILFREVDNELENEINLSQGLKTLDGHVKLAYQYYKAVGTPAFDKYKDAFVQITGYSMEELMQPGAFLTRQEWLLSPETDPSKLRDMPLHTDTANTQNLTDTDTDKPAAQSNSDAQQTSAIPVDIPQTDTDPDTAKAQENKQEQPAENKTEDSDE